MPTKRKQKAPPKVTPSNPSADAEGAIFDSLCTTSNITAATNKTPIALDHHLYNHLNDCWVRQASKPQPFVSITATICPEDYKTFGLALPTTRCKAVDIPAMADTGCQSCLASLKIIQHLGLREKDLIPVTMRMYAANNNGINILGATILRLSGKSKSGDALATRQITYVTDDSDKLFLSREACMALGMISNTFPTIGETLPPPNMSAHSSQDNPNLNHAVYGTHTAPCNCPKRQMPPQRPKKLPYSATDANCPLLQQWLLDHYVSSTFNTCEHQPLPFMQSPPMRLMVNPDAVPVAHHNPIPVSLLSRMRLKLA